MLTHVNPFFGACNATFPTTGKDKIAHAI